MSFKAVRRLAGLMVVGAVAFSSPVGAAEPAGVDFRGEAASADAHYAADRVARSGDNRHRPFAIVDKKDARLFVFDGAARLAGASTVLLGQARGDAAGAAAHLHSLAALRPADRTTPAGRFESEPGHNDRGEAIVWVDYDASLAIHRLRSAPARQHRPERLASLRVDDKRVSLGCIVVPVAFFESVVAPALGAGRGVVYVLPESRPVETLFERRDELALR